MPVYTQLLAPKNPVQVWAGPTDIPAFTFATDHGYTGAAIGADGQTLFVASINSGGDTFSNFRVAVRSGGSWTSRVLLPADGFRALYFHIVPTTGAGAYVVGVQGVPWTALGWTQPSGAFAYVYYAVRSWYSTDWVNVAPTETLVKQLTQSGAHELVDIQPQSAILGPDGALHILSSFADVTGPFRARYARLSGATLTDEAEASNLYTWSADSAIYVSDGTNLYAMTWDSAIHVFQCSSVGVPASAGRVDLATTVAPSSHLFPALQRGGVSTSGTIDLVYPANGDADLRYYQMTVGATPAKVLEELVATGLVTGDGGNGWGANKIRLTRTSTGKLYAVGHGAGIGTSDRDAIIYRRDAPATWTNVHQADTGREPASILLGSANSLDVIGEESTPATPHRLPTLLTYA